MFKLCYHLDLGRYIYLSNVVFNQVKIGRRQEGCDRLGCTSCVPSQLTSYYRNVCLIKTLGWPSK